LQRQNYSSEKILQAASELFSAKGYSNVSIRDLCRAAGTTAPVIYYYFGNKKGLFDAVARKKVSMTSFIERLGKAVNAKTPQDGLRSFIRVYLSSFPEHAFDPGLYLRDSASLDRTSARMVSDDLERIRSLASDLVRRCIADRRFRNADPTLAADCLLGMLNRVIFQHIHFSKASDRESYGEFVTDFFFRAMEPKAA
jgi:TetR/AcrR family transcriptional regulator